MKILLPKMNHPPEERWEVIRRAYLGLFELVVPMLFDKYVDFIDVYAEVREDEREALYREIAEQEDTAMLAQYIRDKGFEDGRLEGKLEGRLEGKCALLERQLTLRFGPLPEWVRARLAAGTSEQLDRLAERVLAAGSIQEVLSE